MCVFKQSAGDCARRAQASVDGCGMRRLLHEFHQRKAANAVLEEVG
jgi:hypothetical protein